MRPPPAKKRRLRTKGERSGTSTGANASDPKTSTNSRAVALFNFDPQARWNNVLHMFNTLRALNVRMALALMAIQGVLVHAEVVVPNVDTSSNSSSSCSSSSDSDSSGATSSSSSISSSSSSSSSGVESGGNGSDDDNNDDHQGKR